MPSYKPKGSLTAAHPIGPKPGTPNRNLNSPSPPQPSKSIKMPASIDLFRPIVLAILNVYGGKLPLDVFVDAYKSIIAILPHFDVISTLKQVEAEKLIVCDVNTSEVWLNQHSAPPKDPPKSRSLGEKDTLQKLQKELIRMIAKNGKTKAVISINKLVQCMVDAAKENDDKEMNTEHEAREFLQFMLKTTLLKGIKKIHLRGDYIEADLGIQDENPKKGA